MLGGQKLTRVTIVYNNTGFCIKSALETVAGKTR